MKKKILTQIMVLSFAFGGLFVVGNNVLGNNCTIGDLEDDIPTITCHQFPELGRCNQCWEPTIFFCRFTGNMADECCR